MQIPTSYYFFWFVQFCIGALVRILSDKRRLSLLSGFGTGLLYGLGAIIELLVVDELRHGRRTVSLIAYVLGGLGFLLPLWVITLVFNVLGYGLGALVSDYVHLVERQRRVV